jgi:protein-S-isoprenylcysteine O-methyltransferase Ste14
VRWLWQRPDTAAVLAPPPLLFVLCGGTAWGVEAVAPVDMDWAPFETRIVVGGTLAALAFLLAAWAMGTMMRAGTPVEPWEPTERIVARGPYRFSRNPIYVSMLLLFLAVAVVVDSPWFYLALPALFLLLHTGVVLREERYLGLKFGEEYAAYTRRVRRWL